MKQLGVGWVRKFEAATPDVFVTHLHIRYSRNSFFKDLKFAVTEDRANFQGRHVINHPIDGEITCEEGQQYIADSRARIEDEAQALRALTGWSAANIAQNIARTAPRRYR